MQTDPSQPNLKAVIVLNDASRGAPFRDALRLRGFSADITTDAQAILAGRSGDFPHLVIVEKDLASMTGARFLAELLKVSWTTASVLMSDEDEEVVHEQTEGLGILGSVKSPDDTEGLRKILDVFFSMRESRTLD
jgi:DNA-binding response OmpR family regulator